MESKLDSCIQQLKDCHAECRGVGAAPVGGLSPAVIAVIIQSVISILQAIRNGQQG